MPNMPAIDQQMSPKLTARSLRSSQLGFCMGSMKRSILPCTWFPGRMPSVIGRAAAPGQG